MKSKPILIGLTGGIASGKTESTKYLRKRGCVVIDADEIVHAITREKKSAYTKIIRAFGKFLVDKKGALDRQKLGVLVFNDEHKRKTLEGILHPIVFKEIAKEIKKHTNERILFISVPLLIETGYYRTMDYSILVYAPQKLQLERLIQQRNLTKAYALKILAAQMPIDKKKQHVDYIVDNTGTKRNLHRELRDVLKRLLNLC